MTIYIGLYLRGQTYFTYGKIETEDLVMITKVMDWRDKGV